VVNAPGTVDAGYRGEILVNLLNTDMSQEFTISRGDRIAQLVVQRVSEAHFVEVGSLPGSQRGDNGHGASGGFGTPHSSMTRDTDTVTPTTVTPTTVTPTTVTPTTVTPTTVTPTTVTPTRAKD
jgi:dUTP pyrophosphatase